MLEPQEVAAFEFIPTTSTEVPWGKGVQTLGADEERPVYRFIWCLVTDIFG